MNKNKRQNKTFFPMKYIFKMYPGKKCLKKETKTKQKTK